MATIVMEFPRLGQMRMGREKKVAVVEDRARELEAMTLGELLYVALMERASDAARQR